MKLLQILTEIVSWNIRYVCSLFSQGLVILVKAGKSDMLVFLMRFFYNCVTLP